MSGKLDQSLDEILSTQKRTGRRGGAAAGRRPPTRGKTTAVVAPVGGVKKNARGGAKAATKVVPTGPKGNIGESKIVVSNLPKDVNEAQIKEYFGKVVGHIRRVEISYGPNGLSRGIANITFSRADGATEALKKVNGLAVDGKPMKIEVLLDATRAGSIPAPKALSERIAQPKAQQKAQPKSAAKPAADSATRGKGSRRGRGRAVSGRPAKKTAEELDSEMADYFDNAATTAPVEAAATTNGGDAMEAEIL